MSIQSHIVRAVLASLFLAAGQAFAQENLATKTFSDAPDPNSSRSFDGAEGERDYEPPDSARPGLYYFNKGAKAFQKRQYAFAIEMYQIAASFAYKPAQFNLAVIYAQGQGVSTDLPRALAWATLAAERGDKHYSAARNAILAALSPEQVGDADHVLKELIPKYADESAMKRAKSRWKDAKLAATGSRLGFVGGLKVGDPGNARGSSQKHEITDQTSASVGTTITDVLGGKQIDGSLVYRELQKTDSPYDVTLEEQTGVVKVGDLEARPDAPPDSLAKPPKH